MTLRQPTIYAALAPLDPDAILKQGEVVKQSVSARVFKNWKKRQLELRPSGLAWRHHGESGKRLGALSLNATTKVSVQQHFPPTLQISTGKETLFFELNDHEEMASWLYWISECLPMHRGLQTLASRHVGMVSK
jgi:hypothetical protein